jgi:hypothetical protein
MAGPVILAIDDPKVPRVVERDLRSEYAVQDRMLRAGAGESPLDVPDRFGAQPVPLFPLPQPTPLASRRRRTGTAPDHGVTVADNEPDQLCGPCADRGTKKSRKGRF